jgi:molecular chaperone HtpG
LEETEKADFGTDIILHIDSESEEFLEESKINQLLTKYCKFLPVPIAFGKEQEWKDGKMVDTGKDKIINNTKPAWTRKPVDLKEEDYKDFYRELYPVLEEPLFYIHLNVDYPFNLTGIFTTEIKKTSKSENQVQFTAQGVCNHMVAWLCSEFLTFCWGYRHLIFVECSRSTCKATRLLKKISRHFKKVADVWRNFPKTSVLNLRKMGQLKSY